MKELPIALIDKLPIWFIELLKNNEIFCSPGSYNTNGIGVIDVLMKNPPGTKWNFIVDNQILSYVDAALHGIHDKNNMLALTAIYVALNNGNLIADYGIWEQCSGIINVNNIYMAQRSIASLEIIKSNIETIPVLLSNYFEGKNISCNTKQLANKVEKYDYKNMNVMDSGRMLSGDITLLGDLNVLIAILYADILSKLVLSSKKRGNNLLLSFIESCEKQMIPFNTRAIYYGSAVCTGYLSSTIKRRGIVVTDALNSLPTYTSFKDILNIAFDLAVCIRFDELKKDSPFTAVLSFDKKLRKVLHLGYQDTNGMVTNEFNYQKSVDPSLNAKILDLKYKSMKNIYTTDGLWDKVANISDDYLWYDADKFA